MHKKDAVEDLGIILSVFKTKEEAERIMSKLYPYEGFFYSIDTWGVL